MLTLNKAQKDAVFETEKNILLISGAGSGKTRVVTAKIVYLLNSRGVDPGNILAITFTNKAATEMKARIQAEVSQEVSKKLEIRTFHSFGARLLRTLAWKIPGYNSSFTILDSDDQKNIIKECWESVYSAVLKKNDEILKNLLRFIRYCKMAFLLPENSVEDFAVFDIYPLETDEGIKIYKAYIDMLRERNAFDFDDLVTVPVRLFRESPENCEILKRYKYLLVDEYQDTNDAQNFLVKLLCKSGAVVTAVGDDDQSIYGFRGANIDHINRFPEDFPGAQVMFLNQNYRSSQSILFLANEIISQNETRKYPKKLFSELEEGPVPVISLCRSEWEEARGIIKNLEMLLKEGAEIDRTAVFYRSSYQSRVIENVLQNANIPYRIIGGLRFFDRKEIKDITAYFKLAVNGRDLVSFLRTINTPPRGIGEKSLHCIMDFMKTQKYDDVISFLSQNPPPGLSKKANRALADFLSMISDLRNLCAGPLSGTQVHKMIDRTGISDYYKSIKDKTEADTRLGNIAEFVQTSREYVREHPDHGFDDFMEMVSLNTSMDEKDEHRSVKLMTIHSAKGLEFDNVFIVGLEDDTLPHKLSKNSQREIDEERRLLYVAVTRAKKRLFLSASRIKRTFHSVYEAPLSPFLTGIDPDALCFSEEKTESRGGYFHENLSFSDETFSENDVDDDHQDSNHQYFF